MLGLWLTPPTIGAQQDSSSIGKPPIAASDSTLHDTRNPARQQTQSARDSARARLLDDVINAVASNYVDSVSRAELYEVAAQAVVKHLGDAYNALLLEKDYEQFADAWKFGGVGVRYEMRAGRGATVTRVTPGAPAELAGLRPGDRIIAIDGQPIDGWGQMDLVKAMRGTVGSQVTVTVRRSGAAQPIAVTMSRAEIQTAAVRPGVLLDDGIGYVALDAVTPTSADELRKEISTLKAQGMRALILDQRNNGGGDLGQSVDIADLFLDEGRLILSTRGRDGANDVQYDDRTKQLWPDLPVVVLVSGLTASGGEGITAALQDNDRVAVVGTPTFGKGIGQGELGLGDHTALQLTMIRWYSPTGRNVNRMGRDTLWGSPTAAAKETSDSALRQRPLQRTAGGRPIRGGGGIVPDVVVGPDAAELATDLSPYSLLAVLTSVAIDVKRSGAVKSPDVKVTPAMRQAVRQGLLARGVRLPRRTYAALQPMIDRQLSQLIARYVFGGSAELRYDREVQVAIELLRKAKTPKDLVDRVTSEQGYVAVRE